jgi:hypothetical protein
MNSENNDLNQSNIVNSLSEILNSLNSSNTTKLSEHNDNSNQNNSNQNNNDQNNNDQNDNDQNDNQNDNNNSDDNSDDNSDNKNNTNINSEQTNLQNELKNNIQLFSHNVDRRIGVYLLDELEKKQSYIEELEEVIKFQQKELGELKSKLDSINKLELVAKLKSNIEEKRILSISLLNQKTKNEQYVDDEQDEQDVEDEPKPEPEPKVVQVVRVKKTQNNQTQNNQTQNNQTQNNQTQNNQTQNNKIQNNQTQTQTQPNTFVPSNPDLVLNSGSRNKVKSISKAEEEEEPRYNGIVVLEKPQKQQTAKIVLDYEQSSEMSDVQEKSTEIIKQRRRGARL